MDDSPKKHSRSNINRSTASPSPSNNGGGRGGISFPRGFSGDALRASSVSAPPPGFHALAEQQQRDQAAAMVLLKPWQTSACSSSSAGAYSYAGRGMAVDNDGNVEHTVDLGILPHNAAAQNQRTTSYVNLAAALGESMAQSMEDSFGRSVHIHYASES